jgi:hypothetical protein
MKTIKKACKGTLYPKASSVSKKLKKGGSFDLNKDGKTTFKDVLIGRGVLPKTAKKGTKVKKAQTGIIEDRQKNMFQDLTHRIDTSGYSSGAKKFEDKITNNKTGKVTSTKQNRLNATIAINRSKKKAKTGAKMTKKCKYGCK